MNTEEPQNNGHKSGGKSHNSGFCPMPFTFISINFYICMKRFGNSRQSSLVPFVTTRFYCIVSNAFKPYITGVKNILKFLRQQETKADTQHKLFAIFVSACRKKRSRTDQQTDGPTNRRINGLTDGWTPSLTESWPRTKMT